MVLKRREDITVYIPASIVSDVPHLREKTAKVGVIGRSLATYRVNNVVIYRDRDSKTEDGLFIAKVLKYMETPQYLRKHIFPLTQELKFAGILPPLRTPHHPLESTISALPEVSYRDGVVVKTLRSGSIIEVGLDKPVHVNTKLKRGLRVSLLLRKEEGNLKAQLVQKEDIPLYWGFNVFFEDQPITKILASQKYDLTIATSKYGVNLHSVLNDLVNRWRRSNKIAILFGSPSKGLYEIFSEEGAKLRDHVNYVVNFIPNQGVETVRTEEALQAVLAILNALA